MARQKKAQKDGVYLRGFAKLQLVDATTGAIDYESPWYPNAITNTGMNMLIQRIASSASRGSLWPTHMDVASQSTAVNVTQTEALGTFGQRQTTANSTGTSGNSFINSFTASWNSTQATASNLGALAMYGSASGDSAFSIVLLTQTVSKSNTQTMNATYEWRFQTTT